MRESKIEKAYCESVKEKHGIAYKFVSPNRRGVPDRIVLLPIPEEDRQVVSKYFYFVELKQRNARPTPLQVQEHNLIRELGFTVKIINEKGLLP